MTPILDRQLEELRQVYPNGAEPRTLPSGAVLIELRRVELPKGWNKPSTSIRFLVPVGYPFAAPDCFWADQDLRVHPNTQPQATNFQPIPEINSPGLWFSWHVQGWNPSRNNLVTFVKVIEQRLKEAR
jgi:E2/UBC family protein E